MSGARDLDVGTALPREVAGALAAARVRWPGLAIEPAALAASLAAAGVDGDRLAERGAELVLAHAAAAADAAAIGAIDATFSGTARRTIARYVRDEVRADELVQELRIHLLVGAAPAAPRLARYDGRAPLAAWIGLCAARLALHGLRAERSQRDLAVEWSEALAAQPAADPAIEALRRQHGAQLGEALRAACLTLSRRHRAILRLVLVEGASVDDAAAMYQVHRVTVWRWLQELRGALSAEVRTRMADQHGTGTLVTWVTDQLELDLGGVLISTVTEAV